MFGGGEEGGLEGKDPRPVARGSFGKEHQHVARLQPFPHFISYVQESRGPQRARVRLGVEPPVRGVRVLARARGALRE